MAGKENPKRGRITAPELDVSSPFSARSSNDVQGVEEASHVDDAVFSSAVSMRVGINITQKAPGIHREFQGGCGIGGKHGALIYLYSEFSICPEIHRRVLEISVAVKWSDRKGDGPGFHFSEVNDGDYENSSS